MARGSRTFAGTVYGIDLGTTYSCLAQVSPDGAPEVVALLDGSVTLPSVVLFVGPDDYLTGEQARVLARAQPDDVCSLVKRRMGDGEWRFVSHGRSWSAPAVSSLVLKALVSETGFSTDGPVRDVVITVPAYFGDEERRATKLAGEYPRMHRRRRSNDREAGVRPDSVQAGLTIITRQPEEARRRPIRRSS
ncbi:MAG: Hsp70 family protein [Geodermatophilaceae bacterium]